MAYSNWGKPKLFTASGTIGSTAESGSSGVKSINKIGCVIFTPVSSGSIMRLYDGNAVDATKLKMEVRAGADNTSVVIPACFLIKGQGYISLSGTGATATLILV